MATFCCMEMHLLFRTELWSTLRHMSKDSQRVANNQPFLIHIEKGILMLFKVLRSPYPQYHVRMAGHRDETCQAKQVAHLVHDLLSLC